MENSKQRDIVKAIPWDHLWDSGAPLPQVFCNGRRVYLIYLINKFDDNRSETKHNLALVEFNGHTFKFGIANDEVFTGLPLWKSGLKYGEAHVVNNSSWIEEIKDINRVHPMYNFKFWERFNHYILLFKDEILEVIAEGYKIETFDSTYKEMAIEIATRMNR